MKSALFRFLNILTQFHQIGLEVVENGLSSSGDPIEGEGVAVQEGSIYRNNYFYYNQKYEMNEYEYAKPQYLSNY